LSELGRLPAPLAENWDWQVYAACRGLDSQMFFHPENERGPSRRRREQNAKRICAECPVQRACLSWALRTREPYGVWGGLSTEEREDLIRSGAPEAMVGAGAR
jgi:WhiB family transcriptional regulator, redox-sensing transcriptional regulator